ncbi:MAG: Na(+)/H(+) antiporter subunit B [Planctomycetaceae bacterium]
MIDRYENVIIKTICRLLIPFIQLYAIYVLMHGHYSPGGGFQGGVMMGASFILLVMAYGLEEARRRISVKTLTVYACLGLFIYSGIGAFALLMGGNYLDYGALPLPLSSIPKIRAMGILGIEIGVFLGVMAIMIFIFLTIASYDPEGKDD